MASARERECHLVAYGCYDRAWREFEAAFCCFHLVDTVSLRSVPLLLSWIPYLGDRRTYAAEAKKGSASVEIRENFMVNPLKRVTGKRRLERLRVFTNETTCSFERNLGKFSFQYTGSSSI